MMNESSSNKKLTTKTNQSSREKINYNEEEHAVEEDEELIKICLQKQIDEFNLLTSIYPNEIKINEFIDRILCDINEYLMENSSSSSSPSSSIKNSRRHQITTTLEYTICLNVKQSNNKLYINVELPKWYPIKELANISIRSNVFSTAQEINIKYNLKEFIQNIYQSEVYIYEIIRWIEENIDLLLIPLQNNSTKKNIIVNDHLNDNKSPAAAVAATTIESKSESKSKNIEKLFERIWIYSHHIKSKSKRNEIMKTAKHLELTGFSKPGKPGIICLEGLRENTQEFWKIIKSLKWQKITIRKYETPIIGTLESIDLMAFRKFHTFQELLGGGGGGGGGRPSLTMIDDGDDHDQVDNDNDGDGGQHQQQKPKDIMSYFMKYLDDHNCNYIKKDLFGFE